jgi:hypothetical protein
MLPFCKIVSGEHMMLFVGFVACLLEGEYVYKSRLIYPLYPLQWWLCVMAYETVKRVVLINCKKMCFTLLRTKNPSFGA